MSTKATVAHQIPGRIRLSIAEKRGDAAYFNELSERLSAVDGVRCSRINPIAGSIVLEFSEALDEVIRRTGARDLFGLAHQLFDIEVVGTDGWNYVATGRHVEPVNLVSWREIDPMFMAGAAFSMLGLLQASRGRVMVPAITAFWYATQAFRQSGTPAGMDES